MIERRKSVGRIGEREIGRRWMGWRQRREMSTGNGIIEGKDRMIERRACICMIEGLKKGTVYR